MGCHQLVPKVPLWACPQLAVPVQELLSAQASKGENGVNRACWNRAYELPPCPACPCSHALVIAWLHSSSGARSHSQKLLTSCSSLAGVV